MYNQSVASSAMGSLARGSSVNYKEMPPLSKYGMLFTYDKKIGKEEGFEQLNQIDIEDESFEERHLFKNEDPNLPEEVYEDIFIHYRNPGVEYPNQIIRLLQKLC